jgi:hypothetical protein
MKNMIIESHVLLGTPTIESISINNRSRMPYLARQKKHCKTPAMPVQVSGVVGSRASCTSIPTEPANEENAMT